VEGDDMPRSDNPEADALIDKEFPVLDKGFVILVDYVGGDDRVVQAARVSYGEGTKSYRQNRGLIDYLIRNDHTSPFEQVSLTFHVKMPIFVARKWVRHRTAKINEISGRYSVLKDEFYVPESSHISVQSDDNKQGRSSEPVDPETAERVRQVLAHGQESAYETYQELIQSDIARELARINLPLSTYTEWYWTMDLHNLFRFLRLRMDPHAQYEIRAYADVLFRIAQAVCPISSAAFEDHVLGSVRFSKTEMEALRNLLGGDEHGLKGRAAERFLSKIERGHE
jgi:thymidylate synthase (FAD)